MPSQPREIQSLARGIDILTFLTNADRPTGLTEIAQAMDLDKSTVYRLLVTLEARGYVVQDADTRRYRPGLQIVALGRKVISNIELRSVAKPWLKRLRQMTRESVELALLADNRAIYIDGEESTETLSVNTEVGKEIPIHCTALGKSLVSHFTREELEKIFIHESLTRYTPRTITTLRELIPHLESVFERGYATDDEEFNLGVRCIAAPILDHRGKVVASVGISGPTIRITHEKMSDLAQTVMESAQQITHLLGHP